MKKIIAPMLALGICLGGTCAAAASEQAVKTIDDWKAECVIPAYAPNNEITGEYDEALAAKCVNGTFVGQRKDDVLVWRGIPYAKQPVGELRFKAPEAPEASDKVYEAYHFMKTDMQLISPGEIASMYQQGEECLGLNIWSGTEGQEADKPVLVFIHGGGWYTGGTADPLYNGYYFAKNNPDVLVVTIDYRLGMLGQIALSSFPDGKDFAGSEALGMLDMVQSLKWLKENVAAFGGDPDNITICGESAGGGAVSMLCVMPQAKGLFTKAIPMSGAVSQFNDLSRAVNQIDALQKEFGAKTAADLQKIPYDKLSNWWKFNAQNVYHHPLRGNSVIEADPLAAWARGDSSDVIVLQGHTADEFRYYRIVFGNMEDLFDAICEGTTKVIAQRSGSEYAKDQQEYLQTLEKLGYTGRSAYWEFMDDYAFNSGNVYQAEMHAKNNGKGYVYTFEKGYDGDYAFLGAAHAADCFYLFGTFNGEGMHGTPEEVELSKQFQRMIANFCKTGDPSIDGMEWPEYKPGSRARMMVGENMRVEENPEGERVDIVMRMMEHSDDFRYLGNENVLIEGAVSVNPAAVERYIEFMRNSQE